MVRALCLESSQCHRCLYQTCGCYNRKAKSFTPGCCRYIRAALYGMQGDWRRHESGCFFIGEPRNSRIFPTIELGENFHHFLFGRLREKTRIVHSVFHFFVQKIYKEGSEGRTTEFLLCRLSVGGADCFAWFVAFWVTFQKGPKRTPSYLKGKLPNWHSMVMLFSFSLVNPLSQEVEFYLLKNQRFFFLLFKTFLDFILRWNHNIRVCQFARKECRLYEVQFPTS